ncbi:hypothetical protein BCR25_03810 [Enterococcus termitis]|uniref:Uncharacterized protein n=2 Tax=Enterococcus termitis TaxID=332950 RepID=A0A1E5GVS2_9ENTE|nr:hypothetical protein BCR25_03810 [Enterococcus termitis]
MLIKDHNYTIDIKKILINKERLRSYMGRVDVNELMEVVSLNIENKSYHFEQVKNFKKKCRIKKMVVCQEKERIGQRQCR